MKGKGGENVPGSRNRAGGIMATAKFLWPEHRMSIGEVGQRLERWQRPDRQVSKKTMVLSQRPQGALILRWGGGPSSVI